MEALKRISFKAGADYVFFSGSSSETKPTTGIVGGSEFLETDTGETYVFDALSATWNKKKIADGGGSGESFLVTLTSITGEDAYQSDKTNAEIISAAKAGKRVVLTGEDWDGNPPIALSGFWEDGEYGSSVVYFSFCDFYNDSDSPDPDDESLCAELFSYQFFDLEGVQTVKHYFAEIPTQLHEPLIVNVDIGNVSVGNYTIPSSAFDKGFDEVEQAIQQNREVFVCLWSGSYNPSADNTGTTFGLFKVRETDSYYQSSFMFVGGNTNQPIVISGYVRFSKSGHLPSGKLTGKLLATAT